jgi:hypothetical protein
MTLLLHKGSPPVISTYRIYARYFYRVALRALARPDLGGSYGPPFFLAAYVTGFELAEAILTAKRKGRALTRGNGSLLDLACPVGLRKTGPAHWDEPVGATP